MSILDYIMRERSLTQFKKEYIDTTKSTMVRVS